MAPDLPRAAEVPPPLLPGGSPPGATARGRKPPWLKVKAPGGPNYARIKGLLGELALHTVCEEAHCPNVGECWAGGTATFMILGDICTRSCRFCAVTTGRPHAPPDPREPEHLARAVGLLRLRYAVITSVDRDDLPDQGAAHFVACVRAVKAIDRDLLVEVLTPDFQGRADLVRLVADSGADVLGTNLETVERLQRSVRDRRAGYRQTLDVLRLFKTSRPSAATKSSIMLGLGETPAELERAMADLRSAGVDILTLGQYLQPTPRHAPVVAYITPEEFERYRGWAEEMGFAYTAAGPLVRSSYRAGEYFVERVLRGRPGETGRVRGAAGGRQAPGPEGEG